MPYSFYQICWIFMIYAFIGWCAEVTYAAVTLGKFVNRGFLAGPVCPIYGFGVLIVFCTLAPVKNNLLLLFLGSVLLTSALEWLTGFILEKIFHDKWWDYSDTPFNLNGYICLKFSLLWGLACLLIIRVIQPPIDWLIGIIPRTPGVVLLCLFCALLLADFIITLVDALKLPRRLHAIAELEERLRRLSDGIGGNLSEHAIDVKDKTSLYLNEHHDEIVELQERLHKLRTHHNFNHRRLLRAFPRLSRGRYYGVISRIRETYEQKHRKG